MNLPGSFLADLPPEATLTPTLVTEACLALQRNRQQQMAGRSTASIINVLAELSANWLKPDYPFRNLALDEGPATTGFSQQTLARGIDSFFEALTAADLDRLIVQEFDDPQRPDHMAATPEEQTARLAAMVTGPDLLVHIGAGNVPASLWMSIVTGLLLRSAQFIKCATGSAFLPRLFAHSLYDVDPALAACIEVAEWKGGREDLESALFEFADCVTATGSDETLMQIRSRLPTRVRFVGYGHKVSFGFVAREALTAAMAKTVFSAAVDDIVAWNQLGCLSPHVIYIEAGGNIEAEQFAERLADEVAQREAVEPRGQLDATEAAGIASRRGFYDVRASVSPDTRMWCSKESTAWTVVYEKDPRFQVSCLNRFVFVKPARDAREVRESADAYRTKISTVGIAASDTRARELAEEFGRWGASRICPLGRMQKPPLSWRHDGRPPLGELVRWTNWERC